MDWLDPAAHPIVVAIRDAIADATGPALIGLYVYGSLATNDFEPHVSDVDLIAVLTEILDEVMLFRLAELHARLVRLHPEWNDRIEVDYGSRQGLAECRTKPTVIARISPGEPLHLLEAGRDFLLDWYPARADAITLIGPPIGSLIPEISEAEYLHEVRGYLAGFPERFMVDASPRAQAYAILTMCRGLYTLRSGDRLSKREAARRARLEFPRWARQIDRALAWRDHRWDEDLGDGSVTAGESRSLIIEMARVLDLPTTFRSLAE